MRRTFPGSLSALFLFAVIAGTPASAQESAAANIPHHALFAVTIRDGDEHLPALRQMLSERGFWETPAGRSVQANPGLTAARLTVGGLAAAAKVDTWTLFSRLLGRETTLGLIPNGSGDASVIIATCARDPQQLDALLELVHAAAGLTVNGDPNPARSSTVDGITVFATGEQLFHARVGNGIVVSNNRDAMMAALQAANGKLPRLAASPGYVASERAAGDALMFVHASVEALRAAPNLQELFAEKSSSPLGGFLFGGWSEVLRSSEFLTIAVSAADGELTVDLAVPRTTAADEAHAAFINAPTRIPSWSAAALPGYLGEVSVQRDWKRLFADRESLLTLPAATGAANFATVMSTLLGQVDFLDDFLTRVSGPARLVMAIQDFDDQPWRPTPVLPGFALVVPMDFESDPTLAEEVNAAALNTLAILSLDQAQKRQPSLRTKMGSHAGVTYVYGEYPRPRDESAKKAGGADEGGEMAAMPASIQYNFTPGVAVVGRELVIATSRKLLDDVIDACLATDSERVVESDGLSIGAAALETILRTNLEELVVNRMLEQNASRADAEAYMESIFAIIRLFQSLTMSSRVDARELRVRLEVSLTDLE